MSATLARQQQAAALREDHNSRRRAQIPAANAVRIGRVQLREQVRRGDVDPGDLILDPPDVVAGMRAFEYIEGFCPGVGPTAIRRLNVRAMRADVNVFRTLDELTMRQRTWLVARLPQRSRIQARRAA